MKPAHIPLASVKVEVPSSSRKQTARMSTGGKTPRHILASRNPVVNLNRKECMHVPKKDLPGEWDHLLPKKKPKGSSSEWNPSMEKVGQRLWGDLEQATTQFNQAYSLMMGIARDLQIHYDLQTPKEEKEK